MIGSDRMKFVPQNFRSFVSCSMVCVRRSAFANATEIHCDEIHGLNNNEPQISGQKKIVIIKNVFVTHITTLSSPRPAFCRHSGTVRPSFDT